MTLLYGPAQVAPTGRPLRTAPPRPLNSLPSPCKGGGEASGRPGGEKENGAPVAWAVTACGLWLSAVHDRLVENPDRAARFLTVREARNNLARVPAWAGVPCIEAAP